MIDPPHDVPDRGPDIVVTAPQRIVLITITELKDAEEKLFQYLRDSIFRPSYLIRGSGWYEEYW